MERGPPKLAERPGRAKFLFRDDGGESRALQTMQEQDGGSPGVEIPWSLLHWRWDRDQVSQRLELRRFSVEGGVSRRGLLNHVIGCCSFCYSQALSRGPASIDHFGGQVEVNGDAGVGVERGCTRVRLWCCRFPALCDSGRKVMMALAVAGSGSKLAGTGLAALVTAAASCGEDLKKSGANPSFELGLTLTKLIWASGPKFLGAAFNGPLLMTRPLCGGLNFGEGLQTFKNSPRSNLFLRLLATEEAEDGVGSNPKGKGLALS